MRTLPLFALLVLALIAYGVNGEAAVSAAYPAPPVVTAAPYPAPATTPSPAPTVTPLPTPTTASPQGIPSAIDSSLMYARTKPPSLLIEFLLAVLLAVGTVAVRRSIRE